MKFFSVEQLKHVGLMVIALIVGFIIGKQASVAIASFGIPIASGDAQSNRVQTLAPTTPGVNPGATQ